MLLEARKQSLLMIVNLLAVLKLGHGIKARHHSDRLSSWDISSTEIGTNDYRYFGKKQLTLSVKHMHSRGVHWVHVQPPQSEK